MSFHFKWQSLIVFGIMIGACVKNSSVPFPEHERRIVMTGILNPDSTIKIKLSQTLPIASSDNIYQVIANAKILCYRGENPIFIDTMTYRGEGIYEIQVMPVPGEKYTIRTVIDGISISAWDKVPFPSKCKDKLGKANDANPNHNPDIQFDVIDIREPNRVLWITSSLTRKQFGSDSIYSINHNAILTASPLFDTFNSSTDPLYPQRVYNYLARLKPEYKGDISLKFTVFNSVRSAINDKGNLQVTIINTSSNYDKYLKSALISTDKQLTNSEGGIVNPFYNPSNTYSNIEGGLGILGSMVRQDFIFKRIE